MQLHDPTDTTTLSYWLNWRVYLCACCVLLPMVLAFLIIWKHEGSRNFTSGKGENQQDRDRTSSGDEAWKPCLKDIHPICLLVFRVIAFSSLLATSVAKIQSSGGTIFYYYTQWTFTLVTIYFGCASILSVYGCYQYRKSPSTTFNVNFDRIDAEQGPNMPLLHQDATNLSRMEYLPDPHVEIHKHQVATIWRCSFQILFQMNAGAVMLTDCVYWFIIFPFLTLRDYDLNLMTVNMHTLNVILLLGDTALNCLRLPWTGISFFVLWTGVYVIFQWIIHACISICWPYPFLDFSSPYAPFCSKDRVESELGPFRASCGLACAKIASSSPHLQSGWLTSVTCSWLKQISEIQAIQYREVSRTWLSSATIQTASQSKEEQDLRRSKLGKELFILSYYYSCSLNSWNQVCSWVIRS